MHAKHQIKNKWSYQKILQLKPTELQKLCNCLVKEDCPMDGLCLTICKYNDSKYKQKKYKGDCETNFKTRCGNLKKYSTFK